MRKIITTTFVTLDGVMQAPGGPKEDNDGGFQWGGWSFHYWDDIMGKIMDGFMSEPFDLLLGKRTYDIFASHWPKVSGDSVSDNFNSTTKYVVSHNQTDLPWKNSILISGDDVSELKKLKNIQGKNLWIHGSGQLIQLLLEHSLIDSMYVWTFPVIVGNGKRLFGSGTPAQNLRLIDIQISTTGVVISHYEPADELQAGSFALE